MYLCHIFRYFIYIFPPHGTICHDRQYHKLVFGIRVYQPVQPFRHTPYNIWITSFRNYTNPHFILSIPAVSELFTAPVSHPQKLQSLSVERGRTVLPAKSSVSTLQRDHQFLFLCRDQISTILQFLPAAALYTVYLFMVCPKYKPHRSSCVV